VNLASLQFCRILPQGPQGATDSAIGGKRPALGTQAAIQRLAKDGKREAKIKAPQALSDDDLDKIVL
jgi:hypothetical protein